MLRANMLKGKVNQNIVFWENWIFDERKLYVIRKLKEFKNKSGKNFFNIDHDFFILLKTLLFHEKDVKN